jgi:hypothetical protein
MTTKSPEQIQRALRLYLIDLQLSDDPHADIIGHAYARLVELEAIVGRMSHPAYSDTYRETVVGILQDIQDGSR